MEFVDEAELQKAAEEPEDEVRGRIVLVGEPDGAFHRGRTRRAGGCDTLFGGVARCGI